MNHHKVQSILAASPCRAGDVISIDQTGWGVASGRHWDLHDTSPTPYDDLFLVPSEQRVVQNEDGQNVSQLYIGWEMPNGIKVGRNGGITGNWWLSRRESELTDRWYTMNQSYQDAIDYANGATYAGKGAGINLANHTALAFTAENPIGVALHDVWPHETAQPFAVNVFRGVFRMRVKHTSTDPINVGDLVSVVPYQQWGQKSASDAITDTNAVGYALTADDPWSAQNPSIEVVALRAR